MLAKRLFARGFVWLMVLLLAITPGVTAQQSDAGNANLDGSDLSSRSRAG
jgi:hypothetical protein